MTGKYFLNGVDMFTKYGFIPAPNCSDDILRPRKRKEPYSNDWPDEDYIEYDLSGPPKIYGNQIRLKGHIYAESEADFWNKYNSLIEDFNSVGSKILRCNEFGANKDISVFYQETTVFERLTRIKSNNVYVKVEFLLQEIETPE